MKLLQRIFKVLNYTDRENCEPAQLDNIYVCDNSPLNEMKTEEEVRVSIRQLKNGKACGFDNILNEFLK